MTSAAVVMVAVFSIFITLSPVELKQIGVGLAVAILIDATLVRLVLLPAILALLGRAAWGPGGRRALPSGGRTRRPGPGGTSEATPQPPSSTSSTRAVPTAAS